MGKILFFYFLIYIENLIIAKDNIILFKIDSFQYKGDNSDPSILEQLLNTNIITTMKIINIIISSF